MEGNKFDIGDTLPNVVPDAGSLKLDDGYICPEGQVVVAPHCGKSNSSQMWILLISHCDDVSENLGIKQNMFCKSTTYLKFKEWVINIVHPQ